jgi:hypothetical protein
MGKQKRKQKTTIYISFEGKREKAFFSFLEELYKPKEANIHITAYPKYGGNSDTILMQAIKMKNNYDKVYAWFDEDIALSNEIKKTLAQIWYLQDFSMKVQDSQLQVKYNPNNKNPIIIVSSPCCMDGFLIKLCGKELPLKLTTLNCKHSLNGIIKGTTDSDAEKTYYKNHFTKEFLDNKTDLEQLRLILSILKK